MKLRKKIFNAFTIILVLVILISSIFINVLFRSTFVDFIDTQRKQEFKKIAEDISTIANIQSGRLSSSSLASYAKNQKLNIIVSDINDNRIADFYGISKVDVENYNYVSNKFSLTDKNNNIYGFIEIGYLEDNYLYNQSIENFYYKIIRYYVIILLLSLSIGFIISYLFSQNITNPIMEINSITKKIRNGDYSQNLNYYDIYEIDELADNLNYLSNSLKLQENLRNQYSEDIAHELRTPLTNLLLHLEGINDEVIELNPDNLRILINETKRLTSMVENLQENFNNASMSMVIEISYFNLSDTVHNTLKNFYPLLMDKNIELKSYIEKDIFIESDKDKIIQILDNLISNAIKAIGFDGEIKFFLNEYHNRYVFRIIDNGIGIEEKDIDYIFNRFYRVDNDRNRSKGGHGLGLSISKTFIELLDGNISVNSEPNKGSEFIVTLKKA